MSTERADWSARYEAIYRFVRRRTPTREEAEDLTQDVFLAAVRALGEARLCEEAPTLAWLYTVARRRLIDGMRRESRRKAAETAADLPDEPNRTLYGPSVVDALLDGLDALDDQQRHVIVLKLFEGRRFAEIASIVGATEEACRARFSRGLATLRKSLAEKGVAP